MEIIFSPTKGRNIPIQVEQYNAVKGYRLALSVDGALLEDKDEIIIYPLDEFENLTNEVYRFNSDLKEVSFYVKKMPRMAFTIFFVSKKVKSSKKIFIEMVMTNA